MIPLRYFSGNSVPLEFFPALPGKKLIFPAGVGSDSLVQCGVIYRRV